MENPGARALRSSPSRRFADRQAVHLPALVAATLGLASSGSAAERVPYDDVPIELSAEAALPAELRKGERFRVWDRVENDGYLNHYVVDSDFGVFDASSTADLRELVAEIDALAQLEETSRREAFVDAVENTVRAPVETARVVVDEPVETLKRIPGGVGRYFKRTARRARDLVEEVREEYGEYKAEKAEPSATGGSDWEDDEEYQEELAEEDETLVDEAREEAARYATRKLGFRKERRRLARELGVDPYTDNEALSRELDRVARAAAAGGLTVKFSGLGLPVFVYDLREVSNLVWNLRPLDLRLRNEKLLREELGLTRDEIDTLYDNRNLGATRITTLVEALMALDGVGGRTLFTELAAQVDSGDLAAFVVRIAAFHARAHRSGDRVAHFEETPLVPVARMTDGSRVVALAVDHLAWSEGIDELSSERGAAAAADYWPSPLRRLVLEGTASTAARRALEERRWRVEERAF
jgi:hypothetical protein